MNCDDAKELLAARIAIEIEDECHRKLAAHLVECADCRATELAWQRDDRLLNRLSGEHRKSADRLARFVIGQLPVGNDSSIATVRPDTGRWEQRRGWLTLVPASAVGFLVAAIVFQSSPNHGIVERTDDSPSSQPGPPSGMRRNSTVPKAPMASLVAMTGPIQFRPSGTADWTSVNNESAFRCDAATEIQTSESSQCEIMTDRGCTLRLNTNTKLTIESGQRVKIQEGQLWCRSESDALIEVVTDTSNKPEVSDTSYMCRCDARGSCLVAVDDDAIQLHAAAGKITLVTPDGDRPIAPGKGIRVTRDGVVLQEQVGNALLAAGWMDALLMRKRPDDPDLKLRVDALLARIGQSKASYLHERELRGLGEHCVLPLTRFVQSRISATTPPRRLMAMRVVADVSPSWNIQDLIKLLADNDPAIRVLAATALKRLTGESFGRSPQDWRPMPEGIDPGRDLWSEWWIRNGHRYPRVDESVLLHPRTGQSTRL
ncbi:MAG: hypothetical protein ABGZ53_01565 [Fuerstiella sp.]